MIPEWRASQHKLLLKLGNRWVNKWQQQQTQL